MKPLQRVDRRRFGVKAEPGEIRSLQLQLHA
jgi:hypothetical protein